MRTKLWSWCGLCAAVLGCGSESGDAANAGGAGGATDTGGAGVTQAGSAGMSAGSSPMIGACSVFPADSPWNQDVSALPVHPDSDALIDWIGRDDRVHPDFGTEWEGAPIGIPVTTVSASTPDVPVSFQAYGDESDPGPYAIPLGASIEGGPASDGDRHVVAVDLGDCKLYELYRAFPQSDIWHADSGAVFDLTRNDEHPFTFTSADAAGLPIFPGLVRYEEIVLRR